MRGNLSTNTSRITHHNKEFKSTLSMSVSLLGFIFFLEVVNVVEKVHDLPSQAMLEPLVASLLLVAMPGAPASLLLVVLPGAPSSVLATSSNARSP